MTVPLWTFGPFLAAAVLLAFWRPKVALLLPLVFHAGYLLRSHLLLGGVELPTTLLELLIGVAVVTGVIHWRAGIPGALRVLPRSLLLFTIIFAASATISAAIAPHPRTAWGQWKAFVAEPLAYAVVLLPLLRTAEGRTAVARALLWGGVVSAGLSLAVGTRTADFSRLRGIYDVPNSLALVLAPLIAFATVFASQSSPPAGRRLSRVSLALFLPTLFFTQSLGGVLAAAVGACAVLRRRRRWLILVFFLLLLAIAIQFGTGKFRHAVAVDSPFRARLQIWHVSLALIRDHPVLGTGLGTFEPVYQAQLHDLLSRSSVPGILRPTSLEWVVRDPHNIVLSLWLNTGLLGLLSMMALVAFSLFQAHFTPHRFSPLLAASGAALLALLVFGLVDTPFWKNDLSVLWWVYLLAAASPGNAGSAVVPRTAPG
ncbi:MAG: hypothetical protein G01um101438_627 [Parcubacteria group bacterium Gr01-1014_38]|nr:MAG: hypothetical protein G01um101438_627 [Parcubacteria group bacterium Gr01-1014_38]